MSKQIVDQDDEIATKTEQDRIMQEIREDYNMYGKHRMLKANLIYIMLVGRTRTGKTAIKALLKDPTLEPWDLTLKSETRDPKMESFVISELNVVLNVLDTPGLFEHGRAGQNPRDNDTILETIRLCVEREVTQFHVICFTASMTEGINKEDIDALKILRDFLGPAISKNCCLIVMRCESKTAAQREKIKTELNEDKHFADLKDYFGLGIHFSGTLNFDDFNNGNDCLKKQYVTISKYRTNLLNIMAKVVNAVPVASTLIKDFKERMKEGNKKVNNEMRSKVNEEFTLITTTKDEKRKIFCRPS